MKYFRNDTFEKLFTITATEVVLIQMFSYPLASKQKIKMKNKEYYGTFISFKVISTLKNGVPSFSCLAHGV